MGVVKQIVYIGTCFLVLKTASAQQQNWGELFERATSRDSAVVDAARDESFDVIIPRLINEDIEKVKTELEGIVPYLDKSEQIRLQASALISVIAQSRKDSAEALDKSLPLLLKQLKNDRSRAEFNICYALSMLQPAVPAKLKDPLMQAVQENSDRVAAAAVYALSRMSGNVDQDVSTLLEKVAAEEGRPEAKRVAIQALQRLRK